MSNDEAPENRDEPQAPPTPTPTPTPARSPFLRDHQPAALAPVPEVESPSPEAVAHDDLPELPRPLPPAPVSQLPSQISSDLPGPPAGWQAGQGSVGAPSPEPSLAEASEPGALEETGIEAEIPAEAPFEFVPIQPSGGSEVPLSTSLPGPPSDWQPPSGEAVPPMPIPELPGAVEVEIEDVPIGEPSDLTARLFENEPLLPTGISSDLAGPPDGWRPKSSEGIQPLPIPEIPLATETDVEVGGIPQGDAEAVPANPFELTSPPSAEFPGALPNALPGGTLPWTEPPSLGGSEMPSESASHLPTPSPFSPSPLAPTLPPTELPLPAAQQGDEATTAAWPPIPTESPIAPLPGLAPPTELPPPSSHLPPPRQFQKPPVPEELPFRPIAQTGQQPELVPPPASPSLPPPLQAGTAGVPLSDELAVPRPAPVGVPVAPIAERQAMAFTEVPLQPARTAAPQEPAAPITGVTPAQRPALTPAEIAAKGRADKLAKKRESKRKGETSRNPSRNPKR